MKTLSCDMCDVTATGENLQEWMQNLMPHYKEAHGDFMAEQGKLSQEEQQAHQAKWMADNQARFDAA